MIFNGLLMIFNGLFRKNKAKRQEKSSLHTMSIPKNMQKETVPFAKAEFPARDEAGDYLARGIAVEELQSLPKKSVNPTTKKAQPSGTPFFVMKEMDWGVHCSSQTSKREYYVYSDGRVEWQSNGYTYSLPLEEKMHANADDYWSGLFASKMADNDFRELCNLLDRFPQANAENGCCDGVGYEMTQYDTKGKIIHKTEGYIYGNYILESIRTMIKKCY